jgi:hypothetical protein
MSQENAKEKIIIIVSTVGCIVAPMAYCIFTNANKSTWLAVVTVGITAATAITAISGATKIFDVPPKILAVLVASVLVEVVGVFVAAGIGAFQDDRIIEMKEVLNEISLPVAILDKDQKVTYANNAFAQLWLGRDASARDAFGKSYDDLGTIVEPRTQNFAEVDAQQRVLKRKLKAGESISNIPRIPLVEIDTGNSLKWAWYPESRLLPPSFPDRYRLLTISRFTLIENDVAIKPNSTIDYLWNNRKIETTNRN